MIDQPFDKAVPADTAVAYVEPVADDELVYVEPVAASVALAPSPRPRLRLAGDDEDALAAALLRLQMIEPKAWPLLSRNAVVVGHGSIELGIALELQDKGARVYLVSPDKAVERVGVMLQIGKHFGDVLHTDLTHNEGRMNFMSFWRKKFGVPHVLAVYLQPDNVEWVSALVERVGSALAVAGFGRIVVVYRDGVQEAARELVAKMVRKHGAQGVTANGIGLGRFSDHLQEVPTEVMPAGRLGLPKDVGHEVAHLCTDEAEFRQGTMVWLGGGQQLMMPQQ